MSLSNQLTGNKKPIIIVALVLTGLIVLAVLANIIAGRQASAYEHTYDTWQTQHRPKLIQAITQPINSDIHTTLSRKTYSTAAIEKINQACEQTEANVKAIENSKAAVPKPLSGLLSWVNSDYRKQHELSVHRAHTLDVAIDRAQSIWNQHAVDCRYGYEAEKSHATLYDKMNTSDAFLVKQGEFFDATHFCRSTSCIPLDSAKAKQFAAAYAAAYIENSKLAVTLYGEPCKKSFTSEVCAALQKAWLDYQGLQQAYVDAINEAANAGQSIANNVNINARNDAKNKYDSTDAIYNAFVKSYPGFSASVTKDAYAADAGAIWTFFDNKKTTELKEVSVTIADLK